MQSNHKSFTIRDYITEDYPALMDLWTATDVSNPKRGDNPEIIRQTLNNDGKLIILEDQTSGKLIGSSWLTNDGRRIYLHHFAISPEYQGQKLSTLLLDASLEYAHERKMQIKLEVHRDNHKAIELYTKAGFK